MHGKAPVGEGLGHLERRPPITLHGDVLESIHSMGKVQPLTMRLLFYDCQPSNPAGRLVDDLLAKVIDCIRLQVAKDKNRYRLVLYTFASIL